MNHFVIRRRPSARVLSLVALGLAAFLFLALLFGRLSRPLFWADEGQTAMYAEHIPEFGYPKVHGSRNVVYDLPAPLDVGVKQPPDAYIGSPWGQYYVAAVGAALARFTDDPYEKTFWVRLPFAMAGAAAIATLAGILLTILRPQPSRAVVAAAVFISIEATLLSLLLHLREARYYSVAALLVAASLFVRLVFLRTDLQRPRLAASLVLALLLAMLFNVFSAAAIGLLVTLAFDAIQSSRATQSGSRTRRIGWRLLPVVGAGILVLPGLLYFDTLGTTARITGPTTTARYLSNVAGSLFFFARYDVLLPVLVARVFVLHRRRRASVGRCEPGVLRQLEAANLLALAITMHLLTVARVPFLFERYLTPVSPLLGMMLVLDALSAADLARVGASERVNRRVRRNLAFALGVSAAVVLPWRLQDLTVRVAEIATPYRGPLDFAIERLRARYPDTRSLVIATNYESTVFMYYLGSRVIAGFGYAGSEADRRLTPDVLIPRRQWSSDRLGILNDFLRRPGYEKELLPVADIPYNNIPEVWTGPGLEVLHQGRTPAPSARYQSLEIYYRVQSAGARP